MDGEGSKYIILHEQANEMVPRVYEYFKHESQQADEAMYMMVKMLLDVINK
jgi:hypothetical protein